MLVFGSLLAILGPIVLAYKLVKEAIDLATEAWNLGGEALDKYRGIATSAAAVDLSTSYFQKLTKGAEDSKIPVDQLTTAFQNLQKSSADTLGGSPLQNRLDASVTAGNFAGNPGVAQLAQANTLQEKYAAITTLVHQAMQDGQRLAAIDITNTALGSQAADNLRKDSDYFDKINAAAAKVSDTKIVSDADIGRALEMQATWDAAVTILEQRWHPIQGLLEDGGIRMREIWINIVASIASAVDWAARLISKLGEAPQWFQDKLNQAGTAIVAATTTPESRVAAEQSYGISSDPADIAATAAANAYTEALGRLGAGLKNVNAVQQAVATVNTIQNGIWKDTSHAIDNATTAVSTAKDAYERAIDTAQKHYAATNADTDAIGLGVARLAEFKTSATLLAAAQQAGIPITQQVIDQINAYAKAAGTADQANETMKIANQIKFAGDTALLSPQDVQIATQLKGIYPDVTTALNSTQAAQIRFNDALKATHDASTTFVTSFVDGLLQGKSAIQSLESAATSLVTTLANKNLQNFMNGGSLFGNQNLNSAQGAVGMVGAGVAGYQSGNPLTGALGGAMAGATFGPAGAAIGGVLGLIGGLLGQGSQAAAALQQAQAQWKAMSTQVINFNLAAKGFNLGPLTQELQKRPIANDNPEKGKEKSNDRDEHNPAQGQNRAA